MKDNNDPANHCFGLRNARNLFPFRRSSDTMPSASSSSSSSFQLDNTVLWAMPALPPTSFQPSSSSSTFFPNFSTSSLPLPSSSGLTTSNSIYCNDRNNDSSASISQLAMMMTIDDSTGSQPPTLPSFSLPSSLSCSSLPLVLTTNQVYSGNEKRRTKNRKPMKPTCNTPSFAPLLPILEQQLVYKEQRENFYTNQSDQTIPEFEQSLEYLFSISPVVNPRAQDLKNLLEIPAVPPLQFGILMYLFRLYYLGRLDEWTILFGIENEFVKDLVRKILKRLEGDEKNCWDKIPQVFKIPEVGSKQEQSWRNEKLRLGVKIDERGMSIDDDDEEEEGMEVEMNGYDRGDDGGYKGQKQQYSHQSKNVKTSRRTRKKKTKQQFLAPRRPVQEKILWDRLELLAKNWVKAHHHL